MRFLRPEYQRNIVKFVKNGGGLFFIGGPRAFTHADIVEGPLAEILPFKQEHYDNSLRPSGTVVDIII